MPILTRKLSVRRIDVTLKGREPRGYVEDQWSEQHLLETTRLFGLPVWRRRLDQERIPDFAVIEMGCLGATSWTSTFADVIAQSKA